MAIDSDPYAPVAPATPLWPPDDTEESVLGINLHQATIITLYNGINAVAHLGLAPAQPAPWQALCQLLLLGCQRPDGSPFRVYPDLFIFPRPMDPLRGSFSLRADGPPVLIVEVLSDATYRSDLSLERGKGYSYARAGVAEYLTLDPVGVILEEGGRGWRLDAGVYRPWERDAQGRWVSATIGVQIALEGMQTTVYTRAGQPVPPIDTLLSDLAEREAEVAALRQQLDSLRGEH